MASPGYTWYGLNNAYNSKLLSQIAFTQQEDYTETQKAFLTGLATQFGLNQTEVLNVFDAFTEMLQGYLFQGVKASFPVADLIQGFYSEMSTRVVPSYTMEAFL